MSTQPRLHPVTAQDHFDGHGLADSIVVYADEPDQYAGNASHHYSAWMVRDGKPDLNVVEVTFQHGARDEPGSTPGALDSVLLTILLDRYRGFQAGPFASCDNACVITKLEEALLWMKKRAGDRARRGVLGTNQR